MLEAGICLKCKTGKKRASFFKKGCSFCVFYQNKALLFRQVYKAIETAKKELDIGSSSGYYIYDDYNVYNDCDDTVVTIKKER